MKSVVGNFVQLAFVVYDSASSTSKGKGRADDCREADYVVDEVCGILVSCNYL